MSNNKHLAQQLRNNLFADRGTDLEQAFKDAYHLIDRGITPRDRISAYTALHIVINTIANKLEKDSKE
jgi:hypothetical protein